MKSQSFLSKLAEEGRLELVAPSDDVCGSYLEKSDGCLRSAKLLSQHRLFENSISMSYYAIYSALIALLFKIGIKCENHSAAIILLGDLFDEPVLFKTASAAKETRIDAQYYVSSASFTPTKDSAQELFLQAEDFLVRIRVLINDLNEEKIEALREKFKGLI